jgi:hypothetical protein
VPDSPYAIIAIYPDEAELKPSFQKELNKVKSEMISTLPELIMNFTLTLKTKENTKAALVRFSEDLKEKVGKKLKKIQSKLGNETVNFNIYFLPLDNQVKTRGVKSAMVNEIPAYDFRYNSLNSKENFYQLFASLRKSVGQAIAIQASKNLAKYLPVGGAFNVRMDSQQVVVNLQMLGLLNAGESAFAQTNDQVVLNKVVIPKRAPDNSSLALVNIRSDLNDLDNLQNIQIQLGSYQGINGTTLELQLNTGVTDDCSESLSALPYLEGTTNSKLAGIKPVDPFLKDKLIRFFFKSLEINPATFRAENVDMRTQIKGLPGASCLNMNSVATQFKGEINKTINDLFQSIHVDDPLKDKLIDELFK